MSSQGAAVPGMILQPIVENAIKYGVARSNRPVTVTVRARIMSTVRLNLTVEDDGTADAVRGAVGGKGARPRRRPAQRLRTAGGAVRFAEADCQYGARPQGGFRVFPVDAAQDRPFRRMTEAAVLKNPAGR
jgi:two-component system LytT family sensor kinase